MKRKLTLGLMLSAVLFLSSCMNGVDNEKKGFISISIDDLSRSISQALPVYDLDDPNHEYTFELTGNAEGEETTKTFSGISYANGKFSFDQTPSVSLGNWDFTFKIFRKENSGETSVDKLFLIGTKTSVEIKEGNNPLHFVMNKATEDDAGQNGLPNGSLNIKVKFPSDRETTSVKVSIESFTNPNFYRAPDTFYQDNFTSSDEEGYYSFEYNMDNIPAGYYYLNLNFFNEDILLCSYPILVQIESGAVSYINGNKEDVLSIPSLEKIYYLTFKYETDNGTDEIKVAYNKHTCVNLENLNDYLGSLKNGYEFESWDGVDSDNNIVSFPNDGKWNSSFNEERNVIFTANLKPIEYNITYERIYAYTEEDGSVTTFTPEPDEIPDINLPQEKFPTTYNIESTHTFEENIQLDGYLYISNYLVGNETFSKIELGSTGDLKITIQVVFCYISALVKDSSGTKLSTKTSEDGERYYDLTPEAEYTLVYRVRPYHKDFDNPDINCSNKNIKLPTGEVPENVTDGFYEKMVTFSAPSQLGEDQDFSVTLKCDDSAQGQLSLYFKVKGTGIITLTSDYLKTNEYILNEGEYKVTEDIILEKQIVVNGYVTISADGNYSITSYSGVFDASSATKLTLGTGNSNNNNLKITNISQTPAIQTSAQYQTAIEINDGVSFEGCEDSYCISFISLDSFLTVNGGSFKNNYYGAILLNNSSSYVNIKGGEISNNNCPSVNYAIQVMSGTLSIDGGSVRDNTVDGVASGAAINNTNGSVGISGYDSAELSFPFVKNIIDGEVQEDSASGSEGTDLGIVYSGVRENVNNYPLFTISSSKGLEIFRDIVNGTLSEDLTIPSDDPAVGDYTITAITPNPYIDGKLANDIELNFEEGESWTPIGIDEEFYFSGRFDGCGFEISGIQISNSEVENPGLFGNIVSLYSDTISNLTVSGNMLVSNVNTGGIAGYASGYNFSKCVNKVTINSSTTELGGIVGCAKSCTIEGCVNEGTVTSTFNGAFNACVGGIVGYITNTIVTKCYNSADITAESSCTVGGIIGYETGSTSYLYNDYNVNTGTITGESYVAGIIGYASTKFLSLGGCANYGEIRATEGAVGLISNSSSSNQITICGCLSVGSEAVTSICYVVDANAAITFSIFDSTVLVVDDDRIILAPNGGVFGYTTEVLINGDVLEEFEDGCGVDAYSFALGRYPIPNIEDALPDGYWEKIEASVTKQ